MATVKVGNPKTFALTQGKEYEVLKQEGRKITIVNDHNVTATYYASVFTDTPKETKEKAKPQEVVLPTVPEIMDTFNYNIENSTLNFSVQGTNYSLPIFLGNSGSQISCGIREINNINNFFDILTEQFEEDLNHLPAELRNSLVDAIFKASVEAIMRNTEVVGMFLASTNVNFSEFGRINTVLQPMTVASYSRMNHNSGNEIKLWVLNQQFEPEED